MEPQRPEAPASKPLWRRLRGPGVGAVLMVMLAAAAVPLTGGFVSHLPAEVPDTSGWQKVAGSAELTDGSASVTYEFYVNPARAARYDVIRYRIHGWKGDPGGPPYRPTERLQWQAGNNDLRRYECVPGRSGECAWRQLERDSVEYHSEFPIIMWVLSVHRGLLQDRSDRGQR